MIPVVSKQEMRELDQALIKKSYDSSYALMRFAAEQITAEIIKHHLIRPEERTIVVAGGGNNGGDALVIAELLSKRFYHVEVLLTTTIPVMTEETTSALVALKKLDVPIKRIQQTSMGQDIEDILDADHIIDGLFGVGLSRNLSKYHVSIIEAINHSDATVHSVDIPSGLLSDSGLMLNACVNADHTYIVGAYKIGNLLQDAKDVSGEKHFIDIGIEVPEPDKVLYEPKEERPRRQNTHKYHYGHVLVVGGSKKMMGAPAIAALAALKAGAGLVTVLYHDDDLKYARELPLEIMTETYTTLIPNIDKYDVFVFGMGMGDNNHSELLNQILTTGKPVVIDADGLSMISDITLHEQVILTPHTGEFTRLLGINKEAFSREPYSALRALQEHTKASVLLKGPVTMVSNKNQTVLIETGNAGLAKAGSGDALSGMIGAFLGLEKTAEAACYLHGHAALLASRKYGESHYVITDIYEFFKN